jgi:hypothetical protein
MVPNEVIVPSEVPSVPKIPEIVKSQQMRTGENMDMLVLKRLVSPQTFGQRNKGCDSCFL